jgi:hypothetical protein
LFDPTIFDNLLVVLEGAVYDLDLSGKVTIIKHSNQVELSTMSRTFSLQFKEKNGSSVHAEIRLYAGTKDLAAEILELDSFKPGCVLKVYFYCEVNQVETQCSKMQEEMEDIWGQQYQIKQTLSFDYAEAASGRFRNEILLDFDRKFDEDVISDIPSLLDHVMLTLLRLKSL